MAQYSRCGTQSASWLAEWLLYSIHKWNNQRSVLEKESTVERWIGSAIMEELLQGVATRASG
jgi:hypothetical protein